MLVSDACDSADGNIDSLLASSENDTPKFVPRGSLVASVLSKSVLATNC
jgi:hypothetical protein